MFTNLEVEIDSLPKMEDVTLNLISKQYLKILFFNIFIQYIFLFGFLVIAKIAIKNEQISNYFWVAFSVVLLVLILQSVSTILGFKKRGYALRTHDILYAKGLLSYKKTCVPFIRIQHVEIKQSFIAKQLNLAALHVYTAGESGGDLSISGLTLQEAERINAALTLNLK